MNILELHNLKKYFATQKAVDDISLEIGKGKIFGFLGPNGACKILKINSKKNPITILLIFTLFIIFCFAICCVLFCTIIKLCKCNDLY